MSRIFPIIQPETAASVTALPLAREVAWDYVKNIPIFSGGVPVEVTGAEAVKVWCWKALHTERFLHTIYTWDYGSEVSSLIGRAFTDEVKQSEASRYVREALTPNPYVTGVRQVEVSFADAKLTITCAVSTIYGEVEINV